MRSFRENKKGQFSIIAALFVAAILISSIMVTYSTINYTSDTNQPQIMSAVDETNLAIKQVLGFTTGYYGSILQVTGNSSYAYGLSQTYLDSGLNNIADMNPEWGTSFNVSALALSTYWFTNQSYSEGDLNVTYSLTGLGVTGIAYSASCRLDVQVSPPNYSNQICVTVLQDGTEPLVTLSMSNFKFYQYQYSNLTWAMVNPPAEPVSSSNGTYNIQIPSGINPQSYILQVQDSRGIIVAASSFSQYTGSLTFNSTVIGGGDYVNQYNSSVDNLADIGAHSNFAAQQQGPDGIFDTMTESTDGSLSQPNYPAYWTPSGSTTCISGDTSKLAANDGVYMSLGSYGSAPTQQTLYAHQPSSPLGSGYYMLELASGTQSGTTLSASASNKGRILVGKFDYPLTGVTSIPASSGKIYYRGERDSNVVGYFDADIVVRESNGNLRATLATTTATSGNVGTSWATYSGSYSISTYSVVSQTDYLEIDVYAEVTTNHSGQNMYLQVDNSALATNLQTSITNVNLPSTYTAQAVFTGSASTSTWNDLVWTVAGCASTSGVTTTYQLYNSGTGQYPTSGNGYLTSSLGTTDVLSSQTITTSPLNYLNSTHFWSIMITATLSTLTPFNLSLDMIKYSPDVPAYGASLEEQWTNLNTTTLLHPTLCVYTGTLSSSSLAVDAWYDGGWQQLSSGLVSGWNNISISPYIAGGSTTFTIRFLASGDSSPKSWQVDAALIRPESDQSLFLSLQNPAATVAVELLQNGTMIWLGQDLNVTTQSIPIPPVSVKAININETINGVNEEVPFQIEDWASSYTVPLGLTNNATVFGNRQMIVFLINTQVTAFTLWWNGSDQAVQTPLAYASTYFKSDSPSSGTLSNGVLSLAFSGGFDVTSTVVDSGTSSTTSFMQINNQNSTYGSGIDYVICNGVVRDIVQQEAEWGNGVTNCPNFYCDMVLTLPANATYFTYQLSLMFINSTQSRTISSLDPITESSSIGQLQTENGTAQSDPIVASGTQTFNESQTWIHHWSQFTTGTAGAGIMFTDQADQMLYTFDSMAPATLRGALAANSASQTISLLPVTLNPVSFQNALTVTWSGAVVTFDNSVPAIYNGEGQPALWILAELPPTISVSTGN